MSTDADARDIAIEVAAIAMRNATDRAAVGMSMRGRRDLAALAYDAIRHLIARDLDEHRDRAEAANNLLANAEYHITTARAQRDEAWAWLPYDMRCMLTAKWAEQSEPTAAVEPTTGGTP